MVDEWNEYKDGYAEEYTQWMIMNGQNEIDGRIVERKIFISRWLCLLTF